MPMSDIVICGERDATALAALQPSGFRIQSVSLDEEPPEARLAVIDSRGGSQAAERCAQRWRETQGGPIIWLAEALDPAARVAGWQAGADMVLVLPLAPGELPRLVTRLLIDHDERSRLQVRADETAQINQNLIQLYRQIDADFRIARRIQRSCRPTNLPEVGRARFAVWHQERMGSAGDFYQVARVDEQRVVFFLGDVLGQSLTSCMLAVFLHQSVQPKEIMGQSYRIVPPDEVLLRLDRQLAQLGVPEPPMVRLTYVLLDTLSGEIHFSCAGHTPPLLLASGQVGPRFLRLPGPMLGTGDARYPVDHYTLQPGDRLLLFTDGLHGTAPHQLDHLATIAAHYRSRPLAVQLEHLTHDLVVATPEPDDFTVLGVEFQAEGNS
jgi:sigma-B regulation protein RsbU (phosphoserine phosphatase)